MNLKFLALTAALAAFGAESARAGAVAVPVVRDHGAPLLQLVQAADPRVQQLEEQVRALTGKVEELTFQLLQLQDQMRKLQEDNDLRFQELEKQGNAGGGDEPKRAENDTSEQNAQGGEDQAAAQPAPDAQDLQPAEPADQAAAGEPGADAAASNETAAAPQDLGTLKIDKDGNVVEGGIAIEPGANAAGPSSEVVAAIRETKDPKVLYSTAYELILAGDYANAEAAFGTHVEKFPDDPQSADARYWLGEAQLGQRKYQNAAETFLNASKTYPDAKKAPDTLLKLGVALAGMNNTKLACATFGEVDKRYPDASAALKRRLEKERAQASC